MGTATFFAAFSVLSRSLNGEDQYVTLFFTGAGMLTLSTGFRAVAPAGVPPTPLLWLAIGLIGVCSLVGHRLVVLAYRDGRASDLAPLGYLSLVWSFTFGYVVFSEPIEPAMLAGAVAIAAGGLAYRASWTAPTSATTVAPTASPIDDVAAAELEAEASHERAEPGAIRDEAERVPHDPGLPATLGQPRVQRRGAVREPAGLSWIVLVATDSPLAVGVLFAVRMIPSLLFGIPFGALTDRFDRRRILMRVNVLAALAGIAVAVAVGLGWPTLPVALVASLAFGLFDTFRVTASQAYVVDLVGVAGARRGVAVANIAPQSVAAIGALVGGAFLERYGSPLTFVLAAVAWLIAALVLVGGVSRERAAIEQRQPDLRSAMALVLRNLGCARSCCSSP